MTCFGTHDLCEIPHGAPVNCGGELQGVFSYDSRTLCGLNDGGFGVFAKVCEFTDWITESPVEQTLYQFIKIGRKTT